MSVAVAVSRLPALSSIVGPAKFNDVVIPEQAGIHGALASADWIPRLTRGMTRMICPAMLRVVAASRERPTHRDPKTKAQSAAIGRAIIALSEPGSKSLRNQPQLEMNLREIFMSLVPLGQCSYGLVGFCRADSIPSLPIYHPSDCFTTAQGQDLVGDLLHAWLNQIHGRDVRCDANAWFAPEGVVGGQGFDACDVKPCAAEFAVLESAQQIILHEMPASSHIDQVGAWGQLPEQ